MITTLIKSMSLAAKMWLALESGGFSMPSCEEEINQIGASPVIVVYESLRMREDPRLIFSIVHNESTMRWWAVSRTNRIGSMQITPRYYCRPDSVPRSFYEIPCMKISDRVRRGILVWKDSVRVYGNEFDSFRAYNAGIGGARNPERSVAYARNVQRRLQLLRREVDINDWQ